MRRSAFLLSGLLSLSLATPAQAAELYVKSAIWGPGLESLRVTLSETVDKGFVRISRQGHGQGYDYSMFTQYVDGENGLVIDTSQLFENTTGDQLITLEPCRGGVDTLAQCGEIYSDTVSWGSPWSFSDVPTDHPQAAAIRFVQERGIVTGYGDGTFRPDDFINRAEFTKMLALSTFGQERINACRASLPFRDVPSQQWYTPFLCQAYSEGLIGGYPDQTFQPADAINFAEAAKIIVLAHLAQHPEESVPAESDPWYERYVDYLRARQAIPATIGAVSKTITRGEMAEMISSLESPLAGAVYQLEPLPVKTLRNWARNIVYTYSITAPATNDILLNREAFSVGGTRWTNPELEICKDSACQEVVDTWTSTDNWTESNLAVLRSGSDLPLPRNTTMYLRLSVQISSTASGMISLTVAHEGLDPVILTGQGE